MLNEEARGHGAHIESLLEMAGAIATAAGVRSDDPLPAKAKKRAREYGASLDFHIVEKHQRDIDARLRNWGLWCNGSEASITSPMFRMTPPPPRVRGEMAYAANTVDRLDAAKVGKAVAALPKYHRGALNWAYVKPVSPARACEALDTNMEGLARLLRDGRQMLINRNA